MASQSVSEALLDAEPPGPFQTAKRRIAATIWHHREEILDLAHRIHGTPELAFEEVRASRWIAEAIARHGYRVEQPIGRLATGVRGVVEGGRPGAGARVAILGEYDALPGLGHGCGHNLMAASGVGAAIGLAAVREGVPGAIVFLGTPAEERGNGKQTMIEDGLFAGVDAALLFHPSDKSHVEKHALASEEVDVAFLGLQAHAAAEPWKGRNALDALILLFSSIGLWRQQLEPDARVHGIIVEGGTAPNIIPARTAARFMIRSTSDERLTRMREQFRGMVEAAGRATGCEHEVVFSSYTGSMKNNRVLADRFAAHMAAYGVQNGPPDAQMGSTDMGNVSQICPAIHPNLAICEVGVARHSIEFRERAISARADEMTLLAATFIAQVAYELLADPTLVTRTWEEFRAVSA